MKKKDAPRLYGKCYNLKEFQILDEEMKYTTYTQQGRSWDFEGPVQTLNWGLT